MDPQTLLYLSLALAGLSTVLALYLALKVGRLDKIRKEFFSSKLNKDFEQILIDQNRNLTQVIRHQAEMESVVADIKQLNRKNIQKTGFLRFNPFDDAGGNMSFCLALLDDYDNGVVISSLHSREGTRIYAKTVNHGLSDSKLTAEEMQVIKEAK